MSKTCCGRQGECELPFFRSSTFLPSFRGASSAGQACRAVAVAELAHNSPQLRCFGRACRAVAVAAKAGQTQSNWIKPVLLVKMQANRMQPLYHQRLATQILALVVSAQFDLVRPGSTKKTNPK
jgi:hypothetical protein